MLSNIHRDFLRHNSTLRGPGFWVLAAYRVSQWGRAADAPLRGVRSAIASVAELGSELLLGSTIHPEATLGSGIHIIHGRVRIGKGVVIGHGVGIMHDVTIGAFPETNGEPTIGNNVFIGAGAKIVGPVHIGDRSHIAANSVVTSDVPPDSTAIGVPAKVIRYTGRSRPSEQEPSRPEQPS